MSSQREHMSEDWLFMRRFGETSPVSCLVSLLCEFRLKQFAAAAAGTQRTRASTAAPRSQRAATVGRRLTMMIETHEIDFESNRMYYMQLSRLLRAIRTNNVACHFLLRPAALFLAFCTKSATYFFKRIPLPYSSCHWRLLVKGGALYLE